MLNSGLRLDWLSSARFAEDRLGRTVNKMPANRPSRTEIERKAIKAYGHKKQEDICIEEMSELIKAIIKNRRYSSTETRQSIREEIADVQIMLDQMKMIFGTTLIEEDAKLTRLADRLGMMEVDNADKTR